MHLQAALYRLMLDPVSGGATVPPGLNTTSINTIWGYALYGVAVLAAFGLLGCAVMAWTNHRHGDSNQGLGKAGIILGSCLATGLIGGVVGTATGT